MLWALALGSVVVAILSLVYPDSEYADSAKEVFVATLVFVAAYCLLIHFAARRRNWARVILLVQGVLTVLVVLTLPFTYAEPLWDEVVALLFTVAEVVALYWLFTGAGAEWYRTRNAA